jgi:hypothetical protein
VRRTLALVVLGLCWAVPARSQPPCPAGTRIPVSFRVTEPICPNQPLRLVAEACGPCVDLLGWTHEPPGPPEIAASMAPSQCLHAACEAESLGVSIGSFAPGRHLLRVRVRGTVSDADSVSCAVAQVDSVAFDVPFACESAKPVPFTCRGSPVPLAEPPPREGSPARLDRSSLEASEVHAARAQRAAMASKRRPHCVGVAQAAGPEGRTRPPVCVGVPVPGRADGITEGTVPVIGACSAPGKPLPGY